VFGLECVQAMEWRNWRPGKEYERTLVLKNVGTKSIRIKYQLPATKYFSMDFPEPTKIGPGLTWTVKITFRPVKLEKYDDEVEFLLPNGSFSVPLIGLTPVLGIKVIPEDLNFGYVAVMESGTRNFSVQNTGDLPALYKWRVEEPFKISPSTGQVQQGGFESFAVTFAPKEASVFSAKAVCMVEDGPSAVLSLAGIGKFPHLRLDLNSLNFGEVYTGLQARRHIALSNPSLVPANFEVTCTEHSGPRPACKVVPMRGSIPPGEEMPLEFVYAPTSTGAHTVDTFVLSTPGGNKLTVMAQGSALGTVVTASTNAVNFGSVEVGQQAVRSLSLTNESNVPARYEFLSDELGVFSFTGGAVRGVLPPLFTVNLNMVFCPGCPSHHWKRVTCLVGNGDPLYVDLIGTAFSDKLRPPPLSAKHVHEYLQRAMEGGNPLCLEQGGASPSPSRAQSRAQSRVQSAVPSEMFRAANNRPATPVRSTWDQLFLGYDPFAPLIADSLVVDFGACSRLRPADYHAIVLTNNTPAKLTVYPNVPAWQDPTVPHGAPLSDAVFNVFPDVADVRPGESATFRVAFRPPHDGQYYSSIIDFVAHVKHMRSFRTVSESNFNAPFNLAVTVIGNTFLHSPEEFSPKFELSTPVVNFPPTRVGEAVHQTIELINNGDTAVMFDFQEKNLSDAFQVQPRAGRVAPHTTMLVALRFCPNSAQPYSREMHCSINHNLKTLAPLQLLGAGFNPALDFDLPGGILFFKPTCVGAGSSRPLVLRNPSSIPVQFHWTLPSSLQAVMSISPVAGRVPGKGLVELEAAFSPQRIKTYSGQAICQIRGAQGKLADQVLADALAGVELERDVYDDTLTVAIVGEGSNGHVTVEPPVMDLGVVLAGEVVEHEVVLLNHSMGVLQYHLEVVEHASGVKSPMGRTPRSSPFNPAGQFSGTSPDIGMDEPDGVLYARTPKTITLQLSPKHRGQHRYQVLVHTAVEGSTLVGSSNVPTATADVTVNAKFPHLQITDAFSFGVSKPFLWQNLRLQSFNSELASAVSETEIRILQTMAAGGDVTVPEILKALDPIELRFGIAAQGTEPTVVYFELFNAGDILPVSWSLSAQDSAGIETENWVEDAIPLNDAERLLQFMMEHRIFDFFPSHGVLGPGDKSCLTVTYKHIAPGLHTLPLLLQIEKGKKIHLHLHGATVSPSTQALAWPLEQHTFLPVPIGEAEAPMQVVPLRNGGPAPVEYTLDTSVLGELTVANHNVEVLRLASPNFGVIPPGRVALLNFSLQPVEAKEIVVDVPVTFSNGKGTTLCLVGRGFHPQQPASEQESLAGEAQLDMATWDSFHPEPRLQVPGALGILSHEVLSLGCMPINSLQRRVVIVSNTWDLPVTFSWDLDQMAHDAGCIDGELSVIPAHGRLEVGEKAACKLIFQSGLKPQILEGEIRCRMQPTDDALEMNRKMVPGHALGVPSAVPTSAANAPDEVLAVHPPVENGKQLRTRGPGSDRLPLHLSMTQSLQQQKPVLGTMARETISRLQADLHAATAPRDVPASHDLLLFLHGRVLSDPQLEMATCCIRSEVQAAKEAYTSTAWRIPTVDPLVKEPSQVFPRPTGGNTSASGQPWPVDEPGMTTAVCILNDLVLEALASPELATALSELDEEAVQQFAAINDKANRIICEAGDVQPAAVSDVKASQNTPLRAPREVSTKLPATAVASEVDLDGGTGRGAGPAMEGAVYSQPSMDPAADPPAAALKDQEAEGDLQEINEEVDFDPDLKVVVALPEVQVFMDFVFENAIYGLLQESLMDDWDPVMDEEEDQHGD